MTKNELHIIKKLTCYFSENEILKYLNKFDPWMYMYIFSAAWVDSIGQYSVCIS
jgi:hypothetical protein